MVAQWLGINIQCVPIDLEFIEEGPQWEATVPFGKDEWEKLHLAYWTRGGLGLHFDIIKNSRTLRGNDTNDETEDQPSNTKRCRKELIEVNRKRIGPPRIPHQEDITTQPDSAVVAAEEDSKKRRLTTAIIEENCKAINKRDEEKNISLGRSKEAGNKPSTVVIPYHLRATIGAQHGTPRRYSQSTPTRTSPNGTTWNV